MSLIQVLKRAGFRGDGLRSAWAIAQRESGGNPQAFNGNTGTGDRSFGLFQINTLGPLQSRVRQYGLKSERDLLNPDVNARVAYQMSRGGTDFGAWAVGPNAYKGAPADAESKYRQWYDRFPGGSAQPQDAASTAPDVPSAAGDRRQLALQLISSLTGGDTSPLQGIAQALARTPRQDTPGPAPAAAPAAAGRPGSVGVRELFYDPLGAYDEGRRVAPVGGHGDHVHASFSTPAEALSAIELAGRMGLRASENPYVDRVDPVHTRNSFHYRTFPGKVGGRPVGEALDVSGSPASLAAYFRSLARRAGG